MYGVNMMANELALQKHSEFIQEVQQPRYAGIARRTSPLKLAAVLVSLLFSR